MINPNKNGIFKGVTNGIHTFTAVKMDNGLIRFYNSYKTTDKDGNAVYLERASLGQFLNEIGIETIFSAYLIERKE